MRNHSFLGVHSVKDLGFQVSFPAIAFGEALPLRIQNSVLRNVGIVLGVWNVKNVICVWPTKVASTAFEPPRN
jgi:hypothetical protein